MNSFLQSYSLIMQRSAVYTSHRRARPHIPQTPHPTVGPDPTSQRRARPHIPTSGQTPHPNVGPDPTSHRRARPHIPPSGQTPHPTVGPDPTSHRQARPHIPTSGQTPHPTVGPEPPVRSTFMYVVNLSNSDVTSITGLKCTVTCPCIGRLRSPIISAEVHNSLC